MVYNPSSKIPADLGSAGAILFDVVNRNSVDQVLELLQELRTHPDFVSIINFVDPKNGQSSLHLSAGHLNFDATRLLLSNGANPNMQDVNGQTPVFCILRQLKDNCQCEDCKRKAVKCIYTLGEYNADTNICDHTGESPLHYSAVHGIESCATALLNNGAKVGMHGSKSMMTIFLEKIPDVVLTVFDRAVQMSANLSHETSFEIAFDMSVIIPPCNTEPCSTNGVAGKTKKNAKSQSKSQTPRREMGFLCELLNSSLNRDVHIYKAILQHPMVHVFADIKWNRLKFLYISYMMVQLNFLVWYTVFLIMAIYVDCQLQKDESISDSAYNNATASLGHHLPVVQVDPSCKIHLLTKMVAIYVLCSALITCCKEFVHICLDFKGYICEIFNYVQLVGLGTTLLTLMIVLDPTKSFYMWLYPLASFGIGICWCQLFLHVGRLPECAIYLEMLTKIVVNFCVSLGMYSFILIAFATSYCMLFPHESKFMDFPLALLRILTMMVGELNFETILSSGTLKSPLFAHLWYGLLVVIVSMVLMNLLVGLAVSDINGCRKNAELVVIQRRIRYLAYLEKSFYLGTFATPTCIRDFLRKRVAIVVPDDARVAQITTNWIRHADLKPVNYTVILRPNDPKDRIALTSYSKTSIKNWIKRTQVLKPMHVGRRQCASAKNSCDTDLTGRQSRPTSASANIYSPIVTNPTTNQPRPEYPSFQEIKVQRDGPPPDDPGDGGRIKHIECKINRLENRLIDLDVKLDRYFEKMLFLRSESDQ